MKIVQINATCGIGSTGKICIGISKLMNSHNIENYILYSSQTNGYPLGIQCASHSYIKIQALKSRIRGNYGFNSKMATRKMIRELDKIKPDIVHLHNIHGHDCNLKILFEYFKKNNIKLVWTFHDCWAFTGYCTHFILEQCEKWKFGCVSCTQRKSFSLFFDKSKKLYECKQKLFAGLDLTIVTPSMWLSDLVKKSFLSNYESVIINNGIDISIFKPTESNFRQKYSIASNKMMILGVAYGWGFAKGLDVFIELANQLDFSKYQIVLVGIEEELIKSIPKNIISIKKTQNQTELAEIYSAADIFINPTRVDNYPTVNLEAIACGTPVLTFKTGGSFEMIDERCGMVVENESVADLKRIIEEISVSNYLSNVDCASKAQSFDMNRTFRKYLELYQMKSV